MERLKELRAERNLLQKDIAAYLGINRTTYVKYEAGISEPSIEMILKLADFFHVTTDDLLGHKQKTSQDAALTSEAESEILSIFRSLNAEGKKWLLNSAHMAKDNKEFAKERSSTETA